MARRRRRARGAKPAPVAVPVLCQVVGCNSGDLLSEPNPAYCIKRRLCQRHIKADAVQCDGGADGGTTMHMLYRFCFQCGKLEPLDRFKGQQRSCLTSLELRRVAASSSIGKRATTLDDGNDDRRHRDDAAMSGVARPHADAEAAAAHDAGGDRATRSQLPHGGSTVLPAAAPASGSFSTALAAAELADVFSSGGGHDTSEELLQAAAEAAYADVAAGLSCALVGMPAPPAAAATAAGDVSSNVVYERLLEQLLAEMQLPWPAAQRADSSTAAGASDASSGDESRCTLLAQHRAWAHGDDGHSAALALPSADVPGVLDQHGQARRHGLLPASLPAAAAPQPAGMPDGMREAPGAAGAAPAASAAPVGPQLLAVQADRMQALQHCYDELDAMLALVSSMCTTTLPLLM